MHAWIIYGKKNNLALVDLECVGCLPLTARRLGTRPLLPLFISVFISVTKRYRSGQLQFGKYVDTSGIFIQSLLERSASLSLKRANF